MALDDDYTMTPGGNLSVSINGLAGRTYTLLRKLDLTAPSRTEIATLGPLPSDQPIQLDDPAEFTQAFYQVEISSS